jgi:hypothetical protein
MRVWLAHCPFATCPLLSCPLTRRRGLNLAYQHVGERYKGTASLAVDFLPVGAAIQPVRTCLDVDNLMVARKGPSMATIEPVIRLELERIEALEVLGMTLAHLNILENRSELSPRIPLLMGTRDKLALALQEDE